MVNQQGRKSTFPNLLRFSAVKPLFTLFGILVLTMIYYEFYLSSKLNEISKVKAYLNLKKNQNEYLHSQDHQSIHLSQLREEYESKKVFADNIQNQVARDDYMNAVLNVFNNKPRTSKLHLIKINTSLNQAPLPALTRNRPGEIFKSEIISISFLSNYEESFQTIAHIIKLPFAFSIQSINISGATSLNSDTGVSTDELILYTNIKLMAFHR